MGARRDAMRERAEARRVIDAASIAERLAVAGCVAPEDEATELVAAAADDLALEGAVRRRERGEPLAWITGTATFCGRAVRVDPGVYVPRRQTEELARRAVAVLPERGRAVDLCTGSGAIACVVGSARPGATVIGIDTDLRAAANARRNGVVTIVADLGDATRPSAFDVVTCVAPYVPTPDLRLLPSDVLRYEPRLALDGGADGLDVLRRVVAASARILRPGGWLIAEIGGAQDEALRPSLDARGFGAMETWRDDVGDLRGFVARLA